MTYRDTSIMYLLVSKCNARPFNIDLGEGGGGDHIYIYTYVYMAAPWLDVHLHPAFPDMSVAKCGYLMIWLTLLWTSLAV